MENKQPIKANDKMLDPPGSDKVLAFFVKLYYLLSRKKHD